MSKNTTINLNSYLGERNQDEVKPTEPIQESVVYVNWNDILTEWSYRCPKGYPTVVDGVFTEYEEVKILNKILEEKFGEGIPLPEAKPMEQKAVTQLDDNWEDQEESVINAIAKKISRFAASIGVEEDEEGESTSNEKKTDIIIVPEKSAKDREDIANYLRKEIKGLFGVSPEAITNSRGEKPEFRFTYLHRIYKCYVKELDKITTSNTDQKEGFSLLFGYYPNTQVALSANNVQKYAIALKKWLERKNIEANLEDTAKNKLINYLDKIVNLEDNLKSRGVDTQNKEGQKQLATLKKDFAEFLSQGISHGQTFSYFFGKNPNFYIERGDLFNNIRNAGKKISNSNAPDKWCPGDVYFIRNGSEVTIQKVLDDIDAYFKKNKVDPQKPTDQQILLLQRLNSLFSPVYDEKVGKQTPIVAVSLKMANAQGGKLKSALKPILKKNALQVPKTYNLDKTEIESDITELSGLATESFAKMIKYLKKEPASETKYTYSTDTNVGHPLNSAVSDNKKAMVKLVTSIKNAKNKKDLQDILKFKYASYKMINFIIANYADGKGDEMDQALKALAAFGLGVIEQKMDNKAYINPPFFKVIANTDFDKSTKAYKSLAMLDGDAVRPQFFQSGAIVTLSTQDVSGRVPQIDIIDSFNMKGLKINFNINLSATGVGFVQQNDTYELSMNFRPNGSSQITVELQKAHLK